MRKYLQVDARVLCLPKSISALLSFLEHRVSSSYYLKSIHVRLPVNVTMKSDKKKDIIIILSISVVIIIFFNKIVSFLMIKFCLEIRRIILNHIYMYAFGCFYYISLLHKVIYREWYNTYRILYKI